MTRHVWILLRRVLLLPSCLVLVVTLAWTLSMFTWRYGVWSSASFLAHTALGMAGPVVVGGAAWAAVRLGNRSLITALPSMARGAGGMTAAHVVAVAGATTVAYMLGLLPVFVFTAVTATAGGPDLAAVANGVASAAALACVGYALGRLVPSLVLPPVAAAITFVAFQYASETSGWVTLTPARAGTTSLPWMPENSLVLLSQAALYALLGMAAAYAVVTYAKLGPGREAARSGVSAAVFAVPLLLAPALVNWNPPLHAVQLAAEDLPDGECAPAGSTQVCVHPAVQRDLDRAVAAVRDVLEVYGDELPADLLGITDAGLYTNRGNPTLGPRSPMFLAFPNVNVRDHVLWALPGELAGMHACVVRYPQRDGSTAAPDELSMSSAVAVWLAQRLGDNAIAENDAARNALERLNTMPDDEVQAWIREHRDALFNCQVPLSELL